jgi:hypothetical protein
MRAKDVQRFFERLATRGLVPTVEPSSANPR